MSRRSSKLLTVTSAAATLKVIPESRILKPCLPMGYLIIAQTPDGTPVDTDLTLTITYLNQAFQEAATETIRGVRLTGGKAIVKGHCTCICRSPDPGSAVW